MNKIKKYTMLPVLLPLTILVSLVVGGIIFLFFYFITHIYISITLGIIVSSLVFINRWSYVLKLHNQWYGKKKRRYVK